MEKKEGKERKVWRRREVRKGKESMKEKEKKVWRREVMKGKESMKEKEGKERKGKYGEEKERCSTVKSLNQIKYKIFYTLLFKPEKPFDV